MACTHYPSDLTDAEWSALQLFLPVTPRRGRPGIHPLRSLLNAVFYLLRTGCPWRYLPSNFPPWSTAHYHFRRWRLQNYAPQSVDHTLRQFSIQANCVIVYTHASYQATCASAALQADGLHFSGCGVDGDVVVPALAPPATPTPTPTPGHYPGH